MDCNDPSYSKASHKEGAFQKYSNIQIPNFDFVSVSYQSLDSINNHSTDPEALNAADIYYSQIQNLPSADNITREKSVFGNPLILSPESNSKAKAKQAERSATERIGRKTKYMNSDAYREPAYDGVLSKNIEILRPIETKNPILQKVQSTKIKGHSQTSRVLKFGNPSRYQIMAQSYRALNSKPNITNARSNPDTKDKFIYKKRNSGSSLAFVLEKWAKGHQEERMQITKMGKSSTAELVKMIQNGLSIAVADEARRTALHVACSIGNLEAVELLLNLGADPNALDVRGNTPLTLAAIAGHTEAVLLLLQYGADPKSGSDRLSPSAMIRLRIKQLRAQIRRNRTLTKKFSPGTGEKPNFKYRAVRHKAFMVSQECMSILKILQYYTASDLPKHTTSKRNQKKQSRPLQNSDSDEYITDADTEPESENAKALLPANLRDAFEDLSIHLQNLSFKEQQLQIETNLVSDNDSESRAGTSSPLSCFITPSNFNSNSISKLSRFSLSEVIENESLLGELIQPTTFLGNQSQSQNQTQRKSQDTLKTDTTSPETVTSTVLDEESDTREIEEVLDKLGSLVKQMNLK